MAHMKLKGLIRDGSPLPKDLRGAVIFHAGPVCLRKDDGGWRLNVIGPTTSIRMEPYAEMVGKAGVRALIGKGGMDQATIDACERYGYVYLQAAPGCAAKLAQGINSVVDVNWLELGMPEAMWDLEADHFGPFVVGIDTHRNSIYKTIRENATQRMDSIYPA